MRRGFTLLEALIAVSIFALVSAGVGSAFVGVVRMSRTAMAESELAVRMRSFREKVLFHVEPPHDGKVWAGLLSANGGVGEGARVQASGEGYDLSTGVSAVQSVSFADAAGRYDNGGAGAGATRNRNWLNPAGVAITPGDDGLDFADQADKHLYAVDLRAESQGVVRRERVVVPIFGQIQIKNTGSVFHD